MKNLKVLLNEFETALQNINCPVLKKMKAGLNDKIITDQLKQDQIEHKNLNDLYSWKNGIEKFSHGIIGEMELFPDGIMLSLEEAKEVYDIYTQQQDIWNKNLFPIFTNGGGDYLLFDFDNKSQTYEMILIYAPMLLLDFVPMTICDSLENLIKTHLECLNNDAYKFSSTGIDEIDDDLLYEIAAKNNPKSKYWDDYR